MLSEVGQTFDSAIGIGGMIPRKGESNIELARDELALEKSTGRDGIGGAMVGTDAIRSGNTISDHAFWLTPAPHRLTL